MKADYKNWVPKGLIVAVVCGAVLSLALGVFIGIYDNGLNEVLKDVMFIVLIVIAICVADFINFAYKPLQSVFIRWKQADVEANYRRNRRTHKLERRRTWA